MSLSETLHHLMRLHENLSISDLAKQTGIPQPTLHHILSGATKNPRKKSLEILAQFFSVAVNQLLGEEPLPTILPELVKENLKISMLPIMDIAMLQAWPHLSENSLPQIIIQQRVGKDSFALRYTESLGESYFPPESLLIFNSESPLAHKNFVLVRKEREKKITVQRLFEEEGQFYLKESRPNGNFELIRLDDKIDTVLGTLIEVRVSY